jgi:hypothetical protein
MIGCGCMSEVVVHIVIDLSRMSPFVRVITRRHRPPRRASLGIFILMIILSTYLFLTFKPPSLILHSSEKKAYYHTPY